MSNFLPDSWKSFHDICVNFFLTMLILLPYNPSIQFNLILAFLSWKREKCEVSFLSHKENFIFLQSLVSKWRNKQFLEINMPFIEEYRIMCQSSRGVKQKSIWKIHSFLPTLSKVIRVPALEENHIFFLSPVSMPLFCFSSLPPLNRNLGLKLIDRSVSRFLCLSFL